MRAPADIERRWQRVERTLPAHVNPVDARQILEHVRNETLGSLRQRAKEHEARARICRLFRERLPQMESIEGRAAWLEPIQKQEQEDRARAKEYRLLTRQPYRWIDNFRIVATWHIFWRGNLHPAALYPFFQAAYEFAFPDRKVPGIDALRKFLPSYKQVIGRIRLIGELTVVGAAGRVRPPERDAEAARIAAENASQENSN